MTYLTLSLLFLAISLIVAVVALARRGSGSGADSHRGALLARWLSPVAIAGIVVMVLTAVFDNIMINSGLIAYGANVSILFIGVAPVEDFTYPLAGLILLPSLWSLTGGHHED